MSRIKRVKKPGWPRRALPPLWGKDVEIVSITRRSYPQLPLGPVFEVRMKVDNKYYLISMKVQDEFEAWVNIAKRQQKVPRNVKERVV